MIDDQPVQSHARDRFPELVEVDRLLDVAVSALVSGYNQVVLLLRRSK
jgi:hypothetical protein